MDEDKKRISDDYISSAYSYLYSHAVPGRSLYGAFDRRAQQHYAWIKDNVPSGGFILDAGCGRGFLLRWLAGSGYKIEGTEIATWLLGKGGDLHGMPILQMYYHQLADLEDERYDATVSSDVIEHLQTEEEVHCAIGNLARLSKGPVLISTGGLRQAHNPFPLKIDLGIRGLHFIIHPAEWWVDLYQQYCVLDKSYEAAGSLFLFGWKK
jgi:2-polyprenyl-3-methyl-5-hydroxy-6-metoxy-1,4-benzoquinol methylase